MADTFPIFDVLIAGGGNAALCAALSAKEQGASVVVLESAPKHFRGGNSRHTRNLRCAHAAPTRFLPGVYSEDEYFADLMRVTAGRTDQDLARLLIHESVTCGDWMASNGARFQTALTGTLQLARTNAFFLGGGKALMNAYYAVAEQRGVRVIYDAEVTGLDISNGVFESARILIAGTPVEIRARTLIAASGGFESNLEWLKQAWGDAADNFLIRGTPYNRGAVLKLLLDQGAEPVGDAAQCHAVAIDARSPKFDGGIVTRLDCLPLGIVVNKKAERFYDEGEDLWPKRYAIWGRLIAQQPGQIAWSIFDSKAMGHFMPSVFPPFQAENIAELAALLGLLGETLCQTVIRFNQAVNPGVRDHAVLDHCSTRGLTPEKTNWAQRIDTPPFFGYPLRPGITFTYLGVKVNHLARIILENEIPAQNIFAAGEIMAGNILGQGYIAGIGMTIGTVFGRIAGREAASSC